MLLFLFPLILFLISLIGLIIASYTDLKERTVSNQLTYGMIIIGLGLHFAVSILQSDYSFFINSFIASAYAFLLAFALYRFGLWAGGDVKLFTGIAALNPVNVNLFAVLGISVPLFKSISLPLFPISFLVFSVFAMFPYGAFLGLKKLKEKGLAKEILRKFNAVVLFSAFLTGFYVLLELLALSYWFVIVGIVLFGVIESKSKLVGFVTSVCLFVFALWQNLLFAVQEFVYLVIFLMIAFLLLKLFFASRELFKKNIRISELKEGMIVGEDIYVEQGKVKRVEGIGIGKVINYLKHNRLTKLKQLMVVKGELIVSSKKACGVTKEDIAKLKEFVKEGKLDDRIIVKDSAPMVPAMLIAYILLNIVGDLLWNLIL